MVPVFKTRLRDTRLITAEILYHLPDHPTLLQSFIWQQYDVAPDFPMLQRFLDFWERSIEGKLHSVKLASVPLREPAALRYASACYTLH